MILYDSIIFYTLFGMNEIQMILCDSIICYMYMSCCAALLSYFDNAFCNYHAIIRGFAVTRSLIHCLCCCAVELLMNSVSISLLHDHALLLPCSGTVPAFIAFVAVQWNHLQILCPLFCLVITYCIVYYQVH